jgi:transcriptional regulator with PAS, ATPase and Fis domain
MSGEFEEDVTKRVSAERRTVRIFSAELIVVDGSDRGTTVPFRQGSARIGTSPGMTLQLTDPTVSRVHCELKVAGDRILVKDAGSTNGTWVNGVRVREGEIESGALIKIGATTLRVEIGDQPAIVPVSERTSFGELVGQSLEMRQTYAVLERAAPTDSTVLLQGETGTGKDVAARAIHGASPRKSGPFVPIDCGAIPESLIESELFGHLKGSFSGAISDRTGVFEAALGGTLFLDEIGEMPLSLQPKLLRAIETRTVRPIGSNTPKAIDARIIAATNRSLAQQVNDGHFREDLYYRLAVIEVTLPPLRSRREDIPVLARLFHDKLAPGSKPLPSEFLEMLSARSWPGNVRELKNFVERSVSLGYLEPGDRSAAKRTMRLGWEGIAPHIPLHLPLKEARQAWVEQFETAYVRRMLEQTGGNLTHAAEHAGVSRRFLQRMIARLGRPAG